MLMLGNYSGPFLAPPAAAPEKEGEFAGTPRAPALTFYHKFDRQRMVESKRKPQSIKGKRPDKERKPS